MEHELTFKQQMWHLTIGLAGIRVNDVSDLQLDVRPLEIVLRVPGHNDFHLIIPDHARIDVEVCVSRWRARRASLVVSWPPYIGEWSRECTFEVLSLKPLIFVSDGFSTAAECSALIDLARKHGSPDWDLSGRNVIHSLPLHPEKDFDFAPEDSALLESVYERIDALCGIARHTGEQPPRVHFTAPYVASAPPGASSRLPLGLHVDTNGRPRRYATAILYLDTLPQPAGDGATVFPCAETVHGAGSVVASAGETLAREGALHTGTLPNKELLGPFAKSLLDAGDAREGVSVEPLVGRLVIFFTRRADGELDTSSWHGGAAVGAPGPEGGKWILQVFKEIPGHVWSKGPEAMSRFVALRRSLPEFSLGGVRHRVVANNT